MATTYTPVYAQATAPLVPRGGNRIADLGVSLVRGPDGTALTLSRDARSGVALVNGGDRFVSRVTRAILTELGTNILNPGYGTEALPGMLLTQQLPLQVADVAMREASLSQVGVAASDQITRIQASAQVSATDPTSVTLDLTITTADQALTVVQLSGF